MIAKYWCVAGPRCSGLHFSLVVRALYGREVAVCVWLMVDMPAHRGCLEWEDAGHAYSNRPLRSLCAIDRNQAG